MVNNKETKNINIFKIDKKLKKSKKSSRKYDCDSIKKTIKTNLWTYINKKMLEIIKIDKIKTENSTKFKTETTRNFDQNLFESKIKDIYKEYYDIDESYFQKKIEKNYINKTELEKKECSQKVNRFLDRTLKEAFIEYRKSDDFLKDLLKSSKSDYLKLEKCFMLAIRYLNYLYSNEQKCQVKKIFPDEGVSDKYIEESKKSLNALFGEKDTNPQNALKKDKQTKISKKNKKFKKIRQRISFMKSKQSSKSNTNSSQLDTQITEGIAKEKGYYQKKIMELLNEAKNNLPQNEFNEIFPKIKAIFNDSSTMDTKFYNADNTKEPKEEEQKIISFNFNNFNSTLSHTTTCG